MSTDSAARRAWSDAGALRLAATLWGTSHLMAMGVSTRMFTAEQLEYACEGVPFPAQRWQLVAWADWNCAGSELREAFRHLPEQLYTGTDQLLGLFEAIRGREAVAQADKPATDSALSI